MKKLNPEYVAVVREAINPCPYFDLLSMTIEALDWGTANLEIEVQRKHMQPFGVVHGGVFASIIDAAAFWAAFTQIPEGLGMTSVDLKLNYLAPLDSGRMLATGRCLRAGRTLCLGEAAVRDTQGRLLAKGSSTLMILKNAGIPGMSEWPPKFLH